VWVLIGALGALTVGVPAPAGAQAFEGGVKIGLAISGLPNAGEVLDQVASSQSRESTSTLGLIGGGYVLFPITDRIGFQPEALFVMKGVNLDEVNGGTVSARMNYLDIPLLLRVRAPINSEVTGYFLAGPNFGILLSTSGQLETPGVTTNLNIGPAIKTLDFGLTFGGGVEFRRFLIEGRFSAGLTDVAAASFPHPDALRNRAFSILAGMKLPPRH